MATSAIGSAASSVLIGAAAFGVASVAAAFSRTAGMLIASRALLGIAGATSRRRRCR